MSKHDNTGSSNGQTMCLVDGVNAGLQKRYTKSQGSKLDYRYGQADTLGETVYSVIASHTHI